MLPIATETIPKNASPRVLVCAIGFVLLCCLGTLASAQSLPRLVPYNARGLWGYADTTGRIRIEPQWLSVQFFSHGRAVVMPPSGTGRRSVTALIDTGGRYVIPPEAGWTGAWGGSWRNTDFNAVDSNGLLGLVDYDGRLMIPREWTGGYRMQGVLEDSFRIVHRDGLAGIVDRQGRIVVPAKWGGISSDAQLASIRAFQVVDPDNTAGNNSRGIADLDGRLLIPPRYSNIILQRSARGRLFFEVSRSASNEQTGGNTGGGYLARKFFDYPTGRQIADPGKLMPARSDPGIPLPGGYFDRGQSLADASGKVIVPCCRFLRLSGDTVVLRDTSRAGRDSVLLRIEYRDLRTMKLLAPARRMIVYINEELEKYRRTNSYDFRYSRSGNTQSPPSILIREYGRVEKFYKDSVLFSINRATDAGGGFYIVTGNVPGSAWKSVGAAVVDSAMNYVLRPRADRDILAFDTGERLAIIQRYNPGTKLAEQMLVTPDFDERVLLRLRRGSILAGYRWQGKVYAHVHVQDECDPGPTGALHYIADSSGLPVEAFAPYKLIETTLSHPGLVRIPGQIRVRDSANRIGILRPDGTPAYPALNFKYNVLDATVNGWFLASGGVIAGRQLLDTAGKPVLPAGLSVQSIMVVNPAAQYHGDRPAPDAVSGIYGLTVQDSGNTQHFMYIDRKGRLYYSPI